MGVFQRVPVPPTPAVVFQDEAAVLTYSFPLSWEGLMVDFTLNGKPVSLAVAGDVPLLWAVREDAGLTGTKFGCGAAQCGACTVHVNGQPMRSCTTPVSSVAGKSVTTIEGLSPDTSH